MAAANLSDLQTWITTHAGPIIDAAMLVVDTGPNGTGPMADPPDASQRTPIQELMARVKTARAANALPPRYTGGRGTAASSALQNWAASLANWLVTWNWPSW